MLLRPLACQPLRLGDVAIGAVLLTLGGSKVWAGWEVGTTLISLTLFDQRVIGVVRSGSPPAPHKPQPNHKGDMPNDGDLFDVLFGWIWDAAVRKAILTDNPARLFEFE